MKRVVTAFALLSLAIITAILCAVILDKSISELSAEIDELRIMAEENRAGLKESTEIIIDKWNKTEKFLKIVTVHEKINELSKSFLLLKTYSEEENLEKIRQTCSEISLMLRIFLSSEETVIGNIL